MYATDVMDDLFYDPAEELLEGGYADEFDRFEDEFEDEFDDEFNLYNDGFNFYDEFDDDFDSYDALDSYDDWANEILDALDDFASDYYYADYIDTDDLLDALDVAVADALVAEDTDEFLKKIVRGAKTAMKTVARTAGKVIGKVPGGSQALKVINSLKRELNKLKNKLKTLPKKAYQKAKGAVLRQVLSILKRYGAAALGPYGFAVPILIKVLEKHLGIDKADEFEALDGFIDFVDFDDFDVATPFIAGLTIRSAMPQASSLPRSQRMKLVKSVRKSTQMLGKSQGTKMTKAMPKIVKMAQNKTRRTGQSLPKNILRTTVKAVKKPSATRRIAKSVSTVAKQHKRNRLTDAGWLHSPTCCCAQCTYSRLA